MVQLTNSFEGITPSGTTLTAGVGGNTGGTSGDFFDTVAIAAGGTLASDSTHAAHGSLGLKSATAATAGQARAMWITQLTGTSITTVWFREYLFFTANPAAVHRVFTAATSAAGTCGSIWVDTAGKVLARNTGGTTLLTSTAAIPLNAWFRVEGFVTGSATVGQIEFKVWSTSMDSAGAADETQTTTALQNTSGVISQAWFGIGGTGIANAGPIWLDDVAASDTAYIGPVSTGSSPNAGLPAGSGVPPGPAPTVSLNMTIRGV